MGDHIKPPKALSLEGNVSENWKIWKQNFDFYLLATECTTKSAGVKAGLFLHTVGDAGRQLYNTLVFDAAGDELVYDKIVQKFEAYINPRKNTTFCRYKFFTHRQEDGQNFDKYLTEMRKLCGDCELGDIKDSILSDMIIIGLKNKKVQESLLRKEVLTLDQIIVACKASEITINQAKIIQQKKDDGDEDKSVSEVRNNNNHRGKYKKKKSTGHQQQNDPGKVVGCTYCSLTHNKGACPAFNKKCSYCGGKGHIVKCCRTKIKDERKVGSVTSKPKIASDSDSDDSCRMFAGAVGTSDTDDSEDWTIDLTTNGTLINYKIDTGAQTNILPYNDYMKLHERPKLNATKVTLSAYNNSDIPVKGSSILKLHHRGKSTHILFIIADIDSKPILGLKSSCELDIIRRIDNVDVNKKGKSKGIPAYLDKFKCVFEGLGCFSKVHHTYTNPDVNPSINPPRRVPLAIESKLYDEIQRMKNLGVIVPVEEPSDWCSSYVAVEKPDKSLRLCLDPRELNKAIKRPTFELPTTDEILSRVSTGNFFTKIDASTAYWQIPVDEASSRLLTFSTPFGRFRYTRMPYGISSASDVCQKYISEVISHIDGAINSQDDILIWGHTKDELKTRTIKVFEAILESGMKLNQSKCQFELTEIKFLGHKITQKGIEADDSKIKAITNMEYPTTVKELQRFLGSINYLGKFIPNLTDKTVSLRKLLQKDTKWVFDQNHMKEFDALKKCITMTPVLKKFNEKLPIRISCDASCTGLGAILEQKMDDDWYPIAYSSRSLTSAEQNYCQLERETLSILFACNKFHQYVYGRQFHVYNDHKPLKSIFNKPISKAPARIQRFLLRLQQYSFDLHYIEGSKLYIPDTLSRSSLKDSTPEITDVEMRYFVHTILSKDLISSNMMKRVVAETAKDEIYSEWMA